MLVRETDPEVEVVEIVPLDVDVVPVVVDTETVEDMTVDRELVDVTLCLLELEFMGMDVFSI